MTIIFITAVVSNFLFMFWLVAMAYGDGIHKQTLMPLPTDDIEAHS